MSQETTISMPSPPSQTPSARLIATLGIAGFLSGLVLVGTYLFTLPMIQSNRATSLQRAIYEVLPGCVDFKPLEINGSGLVVASMETNQKAGEETPKIFAGYASDGKLIGFAIPAQQAGFQDIISGILGYDPIKKEIIGFVVLESRETPGLGDKIYKDAAFQDNFRALAVEPEIVCVKHGEKKHPNEVDAITGATISSKAVARLLQGAMEKWKQPIESYLQNQ